MKNITTVILAAGRSTRFISNKSKLTNDLAGLPIVSHVYNIAKKISGKNVIVVCNKDNHDELNSILHGEERMTRLNGLPINITNAPRFSLYAFH